MFYSLMKINNKEVAQTKKEKRKFIYKMKVEKIS